jgi:hypothetical protein
MTDYVKSTNFASKDSLSVGNPLKIVKGTEIDAEFNNIAVAVATKADIANPTFTGVPSSPTASLGTNTTQLATTAFVLQHLYPVGSVYINAGVSTNPATLFGFGTWVAFGAGRVMVGLNGSDSLFDTLEETGGSKDAAVISHTHTASTGAAGAASGTSSGGNYNGDFGIYNAATGVFSLSGPLNPNRPQGSGGGGSYPTVALSIPDHTHAVTVNATGSSGTNANLQPYITVAMWKRTA